MEGNGDRLSAGGLQRPSSLSCEAASYAAAAPGWTNDMWVGAEEVCRGRGRRVKDRAPEAGGGKAGRATCVSA